MLIRSTLLALVISFPLHVGLSQQDNDEEPPWSASVGVRYLNRYTSYGVDLSGDRPAFAPSVSLSHANGLSANAEGIITDGAGGGLQRWSFGIGYEASLSDAFTLSADFTHFGNKNDTANVLAGLSNALSISAELDLDVVSVSATVDRYIGSGGATYFGADVSSFVELGAWTIVPLAQATFVSQTVSISRTKLAKTMGGPRRGSGGTVTTTTLTGLSSFSIHAVAIYPMIEGLSFVLHPSIVYSPLAEISSRKTQFVWSAGVRYSIQF